MCHVHASETDRGGAHADERIRAIEQHGLDAADRVVCVSRFTARGLRRDYRVDPRKLRVVHNAVAAPGADRPSAPRDSGEPGDERADARPLVLFLGRVTRQKGPEYFLQAAARVVAVEPRVRFALSGDGDLLPAMVERAAELGLARHVHFTGFLGRADVERMYARADVYVMPSVSEPFGITSLEAMSADVPVVLSRQSGVTEVLQSSLKVDYWDVESLADRILALLRLPALRRQLIEDGREEMKRLRWTRSAGLLHGIYRELVA